MFTKKKRGKKRSRAMLSAYSIIMILIVLLGVLSHVLPRAKYAAVSLQDVESVEVGPGEWEGESPNGGPEELKVEAPEVTDEERMEGESVDVVEVDDESRLGETGDDLGVEAESRMITEEPMPEDEKMNRVAEDLAPAVSDTETFDSLEACEEAYGEGACAIVDGSGVEGAALYQILMAPILGFADAIDVCIFIMMLGGLLAVVSRTKALETGIKLLVQKLKGKEYLFRSLRRSLWRRCLCYRRRFRCRGGGSLSDTDGSDSRFC